MHVTDELVEDVNRIAYEISGINELSKLRDTVVCTCDQAQRASERRGGGTPAHADNCPCRIVNRAITQAYRREKLFQRAFRLAMGETEDALEDVDTALLMADETLPLTVEEMAVESHEKPRIFVEQYGGLDVTDGVYRRWRVGNFEVEEYAYCFDEGVQSAYRCSCGVDDCRHVEVIQALVEKEEENDEDNE